MRRYTATIYIKELKKNFVIGSFDSEQEGAQARRIMQIEWRGYSRDRTKVKQVVGTREYTSYNSMKTRCYNPKRGDYHLYGGRGITVCDHWLRDFANFLYDMGERPQGMTLDRIDVNGNYCKENCKWSDGLEQARNRRVRRDSKTGIRGVYEKNGKYSASICVNGETRCLGTFSTVEGASTARREAEVLNLNLI